MVLNGAANRDPRQFDDPDELRLDRVERPPAPRVRVRHPHLRGRAARAGRGPRQPRAHPRPHGRHQDLGGRARPGRRAPLRVHADLHAARPRAACTCEFTPTVTATVPDVRSSGRAISAHDEQFRDELRAWLAEHPPPAVDVATTPEEAEALRAWQRTLHAGGWVGIHWPVEYGGRGASPAQVAIYNEELARAGAPPLLGRGGISLVGPTLMAHGTEEQRRRWMPRILAGDDVWCQLFSEPDAGSDLAGLTTRAEQARRRLRRERAEGVVVVRAVRRLGDRARAHRSATRRTTRGSRCWRSRWTAKGVEIRPLRQITGESEFNEVFLDDVEVPVENLIGPEHEGWRVANTTLANERGASFVWKEQVLHEVAMDQPDRGVRRARAGSATRACASGSRGRGSMSRSSACTTRARSTRLARGEELGAGVEPREAVLGRHEPAARRDRGRRARARRAAHAGRRRARRRWPVGARLLATRANSIMGGTSEIQRNIIGERLLGLPREPKAAMTRGRRRARPRRPRALRARRVPARRCGRGCGPRRRSRTSRPTGYEPFWAITKHADILEIAKQPLRFSSAQGITLRARRAS